MGKLSRLLLPLLFVGCGGVDNLNCYTWGIDCAESKPGTDGERGTMGPIGDTGLPGEIGPRGIQGRAGEPGGQGEPGPTGSAGERGEQGDPGSNCTVANTITGATVFCEDGTIATISNGIDGINGSDGESIVGPQGEPGQDAPPTPFTVVELIDPCGQEAVFDEVLLRMADGSLMAHYSAGGNQFLTLVPPGSYATTDGTGCTFIVTSELTVIDKYDNEWSVN